MSEISEFPLETYTAQEQERLQEFRKALSNLKLTEDQTTDAQLIRWLRARDLNVKKAVKMLEAHLKWRVDNQVDGILTQETVSPALETFLRMGYLGEDREGYPVIVVPLGPQDTRALIEEFGEEKMIRMLILRMERVVKLLEEVSERQGREVTQFVQVMDMDGYSVKENVMNKACRTFSGKRQELCYNNYPDIIRSIMVINAPNLLYKAVRILKPFINKKTLDRMVIYGQDKEEWKRVMCERFPPEIVPKHWGGTRHGSDEYCSKDEDIWINGPLPPNFFTGIKASEDDKLTTVTIKAREHHKVAVQVDDAKSSIMWKMKIEKRDDQKIALGFQILDPNDTKLVDSQDKQEWEREGTIPAEQAGTYTAIFNNFQGATDVVVEYSLNVLESMAVQQIAEQV